MAMAGAIGASIDVSPAVPAHGLLFGEDQARYVVTVAPDTAEGIRDAAGAAGVACEIIGLTGGDTLTLGSGTAILVEDLGAANEIWLPRYMAQSHV